MKARAGRTRLRSQTFAVDAVLIYRRLFAIYIYMYAWYEWKWLIIALSEHVITCCKHCMWNKQSPSMKEPSTAVINVATLTHVAFQKIKTIL